MLRLDAAAMSLALLFMACSFIPQVASEPDPSQVDDGQGSAYSRHAWTEAREVPDGDRQGILIGPVLTDGNGAELGPVVLRLDINHPATGDLDIWLAYDADEDGNPEARAPVEFFRARLDVRAEELHACPSSLNGTYFFRDGTGGEETVFAPFHELPRGHAFYLAVADTLADERGKVLGWAVYTKEPEPRASD